MCFFQNKLMGNWLRAILPTMKLGLESGQRKRFDVTLKGTLGGGAGQNLRRRAGTRWPVTCKPRPIANQSCQLLTTSRPAKKKLLHQQQHCFRCFTGTTLNPLFNHGKEQSGHIGFWSRLFTFVTLCQLFQMWIPFKLGWICTQTA